MFTTIIRILILYVLVIFAMRIMGKRQIADMQPTELVVTILISEIAAIPIQDASRPVLSAVIAIFALVALEIALAVLSMKSAFFNSITNGKSAVVIEDGVILQDRLKKMRVTVADLVELLRVQGIFDISEVSYAILETNGNLSVLQKPYYRTPRAGDLNVAEEDHGCPALIVSDGTFMKRGLNDAHFTEEQVLKILRTKQITVEEIFLMTLDRDGNSVIVKKRGTQ